MMQFEDAILILNGPAGTNTRPGKIAVGTGLGYWMSKNEPPIYTPTHILSGRRCTHQPFFSEEICQQYIEALAPLMNWNQPIETLSTYKTEQFNKIEKKFWIEDAAATAGGGRW